jgi:RHS repeat-associated protein
MTDANSNITTYTYDVINRLITEKNALGYTTTYTYDGNSNLLTIKDANGNTTSYTYDALNRLTKTTYPDGTYETFSYDADSNLISKRDRNGNTITNTYDSLHRLTTNTYPDSTKVNYTYNFNGNILTAGNPDISYSFNYDALNRVTKATNVTLSKTVSYSYLCCGLKSSMTNPEGGVSASTYDALKRLTRLTNPLGENTTHTYDNLSRIINKDMGNGTYTTYTYDSLSRLLNLINKTSSDSTISSYSYTYDNTANRTSMTTLSGAHNYSYDKIYELLQATHPASSTETYTYDPVYNRLTSASNNNWTYDKNNRLMSFNVTTYTYDANGNTLSKTDASGTTAYQYDFENRLKRIDYPDGTYSEYRYDPFGNRIKKDVNGTVTWFVYDLAKALPDVIAEYDNSGSLLVSYTHGVGIDEVLSMRRNGNSYFYLKDGLGSVTSLTNGTEAVVNSYEYDAFGNVVSKTESVNNPYGYTGRELDNESGLMYYRARYYDSEIGRFITADPIGFDAGVNFYAYVFNNPMSETDPSGKGLLDCVRFFYYAWKCAERGQVLIFGLNWPKIYH